MGGTGGAGQETSDHRKERNWTPDPIANGETGKGDIMVGVVDLRNPGSKLHNVCKEPWGKSLCYTWERQSSLFQGKAAGNFF